MIIVRREELREFIGSCDLVGNYQVSIEGVLNSPYAKREIELFDIEDTDLEVLEDWAGLFKGTPEEDTVVLIFIELNKPSIKVDFVNILEIVTRVVNERLHRADVEYLIDEYKSVYEVDEIIHTNLADFLMFVKGSEF